MDKISTVTQALEHLKSEIQKETTELQQKDAALKASIAEEENLVEGIKRKETEIKQKEFDIQKLKAEISQDKVKIGETERHSKKLTMEVTDLKRKHSEHDGELVQMQREYQTSLKDSGVKITR